MNRPADGERLFLRPIILALSVLLTAVGGCAARPADAWQPAQAELVAWWIEDVAHGAPRLPEELQLVESGPGDELIARWAAGSRISGRWVPPRQLNMRRGRWPALVAALDDGSVVPAGDSGLLAPSPGVRPTRRAEIDALVDAENNDRRFIDGLVLSLAAPDPQVERIFRSAAGAARRELDTSGAEPATTTR